VARYRDSEVHEKSEVGLVTGLAWTEVGGSILTTEVQVLDGKGKLTITGQLGDVMQESAQAALSYIRGKAQALGLTREFYRNVDLHLHVPEGAIPKDGPSAGITMATALASALAKIPVRRDIAMTGEITLRGKVLAIGGLKEKLLAALRAGIFEVILPRANEKDIAELPDNIKNSMKMHFVDQMDEVLTLALESELVAATPLKTKAPDQANVLRLQGNMSRYEWLINGQEFDVANPGTQQPQVRVKAGQRVALKFVNETPMSHPMHLHGHSFQVVAINDRPLRGALRDTVLVPGLTSVTVEFDANNPGLWFVHCHVLWHLEAGMATLVQYEA